MHEDIGQQQPGDQRGHDRPRPQPHRMLLHSREGVDPFRRRRVSRDWQFDPERLHVGEHEHSGRRGVGEHAPAPQVIPRPHPPRQFDPFAVGIMPYEQVGHRPTAAAHPPLAAVDRQRVVVGLVQLPRVREQPADEHHHRWQPHHLAHRQLQRLQAKPLLQHVPRLGEAEAEPVARAGPLDSERPPATKDRSRHERLEEVRGTVAKRGEAVGIDDRSLLPGRLSGEGVEWHLFRAGRRGRAHRHRHRHPATAIGVDHEVDRGPPHLPRIGIEG